MAIAKIAMGVKVRGDIQTLRAFHRAEPEGSAASGRIKIIHFEQFAKMGEEIKL